MSAIVGVLQATHAMIAMRRDEQHWLLSDQDARAYGQAVQNALRHIPIKVAQKTVDFAALAFAVGQYEFPRIYTSVQISRARAAAARSGRPAATVYPIYQQPRPPQGTSGPPPSTTPPAGSSPHGSTGGGAPPAAAANANGQDRGLDPIPFDIEPEFDVPRFGPM